MESNRTTSIAFLERCKRAFVPPRLLLCAGFITLTFPTAIIAEGDPEAGAGKVTTCVACHGVGGNSTNPEWPKLAGQGAKYIIKQLQLFRDNQRINSLMNAQVANLSDRDMADIAAYYQNQAPLPSAADESLATLGEQIYRGGIAESKVPACLSCHGPDGAGNPAANFPRVSYQHATYLTARLRQYRAGETYPGSEIMNDVAKGLTDEQIEAVASYMQGLH